MTALEARLALYGVLLAVIGGWLVYERVHLIDEGEARVKAADASAAARQKAEDEKVSAGVVNDLNQRLTALSQPRPAPIMRLCVPTRYVQAQPAARGTQPGVAETTSTSADRVPPGADGIDIGPAVSDVERAAEVVAIFRNSTWEWAVKQAQPVR